MSLNWSWTFTWEILPLLLKALWVTVQATIYGMAIAAVLGMIWAMLRRSEIKAISWPVASFVEFIRSTPLLVQLFFFFYALPSLGVSLPPFLTGVLALGLHYSTYTSEVYRAGINSVPRGQWEAAAALNLPAALKWRAVIIPQALPPVLPALGNYLIAMFKDTPLLAAITVVEMLNEAKMIGAEKFRYLEPLTMVGVLFLIVSLISAAGVNYLERRLTPAAR